MAPAHRAFLLEAPNGFSGKVSAETAGIIATLYALSELSFQYPTQDRFATRFHQLRAYALDHPQVEAIFAAID
jgi:hypothetical protein